MRLIRFLTDGFAPRAGVLDGDVVTGFAGPGSLGDLLALPVDGSGRPAPTPAVCVSRRPTSNCSPRWTAAWRCGRPA